MKQKNCLCFIICILTLILSGCAKKPEMEHAAIGIIETRGNIKKSRILFYDKDLNETGSIALKEASVGNIYHLPFTENQYLYLIPQGYDIQKDEKKVLQLNLKTLEQTEYRIDQLAMNGVVATEKYVYTYNTSAVASYINQCDKETGTVKTIDFPDIFINHILLYDDNLYVFGTALQTGDNIPSYLFIFTDTLEQTGKIELTELGISQYKSIVYQNKIYFTNMRNKSDNKTSMIGKYSPESNTLDQIDVGHINPWDLIIYNDKLIVSHCDITQQSNGALSFYDFDKEEWTYHEMPHSIEQMVNIDNLLYVLSDRNIYVYDLETLNCLNEITVDPIDNNFSYISGIFTIN